MISDWMYEQIRKHVLPLDTTEEPMTPNPGSNEAIKAGCTCAVLDNAHGTGYMGQAGVFVYTSGCPVHRGPSVGECLNGCGRAAIQGERYCSGNCEAEARGELRG